MGIRSPAHARGLLFVDCLGCCVNDLAGALALWQPRMGPAPGYPNHWPWSGGWCFRNIATASDAKNSVINQLLKYLLGGSDGAKRIY